MKRKTSELAGAALDWAVAKCEGEEYEWMALMKACRQKPNYSTNWAQGGPIIARERINIYRDGGGHSAGIMLHDDSGGDDFEEYGPTPLIAAMRAYVASKLGDEVEIPEELT